MMQNILTKILLLCGTVYSAAGTHALKSDFKDWGHERIVIGGCAQGKSGACKTKTNAADYIQPSLSDGSLLTGTQNLQQKEISNKNIEPRLRLTGASVTLKNKIKTYAAITGNSGECIFDTAEPGLYYLSAAHSDYEDQRNLPVTIDSTGQMKVVLLGDPDERAERGVAVVELYDKKLNFNILPYISLSSDNDLVYKIVGNKIHISGVVFNKTYSMQVVGELLSSITYDTLLSFKIAPIVKKPVGTPGTKPTEKDLLNAAGKVDYFISGAFSKKLYLKDNPVMHYPENWELLTGNALIINESGNLLTEYVSKQSISVAQLEKSLFGISEMSKDGAGFGIYQVNVCAKGDKPVLCDNTTAYTAFYHFDIIQGRLDSAYNSLRNQKFSTARAQEGHATTEKLNLEMYGLGVGLANRKAPAFWTAASFSKFSETLKRKTIAYKDNKVYVSFSENKITSGSSLNEILKIEFCNSCNTKGKDLFYHYALGLIKNNSDVPLKMTLRFKLDKDISYSLKFECNQNSICNFRDLQNQFLESLGYKDEVTYRRDLRANTGLIPYLGNFLELQICDMENDYECVTNAAGGLAAEVASLGIGKVFSTSKRFVLLSRKNQLGKHTKVNPEDARRLEELIGGAGKGVTSDGIIGKGKFGNLEKKIGADLPDTKQQWEIIKSQFNTLARTKNCVQSSVSWLKKKLGIDPNATDRTLTLPKYATPTVKNKIQHGEPLTYKETEQLMAANQINYSRHVFTGSNREFLEYFGSRLKSGEVVLVVREGSGGKLGHAFTVHKEGSQVLIENPQLQLNLIGNFSPFETSMQNYIFYHVKVK